MRQVNCTDSSRRVVSCRVSDSHGLGGLCGRLENHTERRVDRGLKEARREKRREDHGLAADHGSWWCWGRFVESRREVR